MIGNLIFIATMIPTAFAKAAIGTSKASKTVAYATCSSRQRSYNSRCPSIKISKQSIIQDRRHSYATIAHFSPVYVNPLTYHSHYPKLLNLVQDIMRF